MHIVLGILTSVVTVLYLLERLGVDIGWLNPWSWRRRRAWANKYEGDPIYSIEDPMHVAAILIVGTVKLEGDLTAEQKNDLLSQFEQKFSLDARAASDLLGSTTHLLGAPQVVGTQLQGLADKRKNVFSRDQAESMIEMAAQVAAIGAETSTSQRDYIDGLRSLFVTQTQDGTWS